LIDDEADIREVVSLTLLDAGYDVITAPDGETGIELCKSRRPQIVTTDIRMPGMNGIQVLEEVKKFDSDIEVIVVTAFGEMNLLLGRFSWMPPILSPNRSMTNPCIWPLNAQKSVTRLEGSLRIIRP
jgi:CheY-like chemotaxis protein